MLGFNPPRHSSIFRPLSLHCCLKVVLAWDRGAFLFPFFFIVHQVPSRWCGCAGCHHSSYVSMETWGIGTISALGSLTVSSGGELQHSGPLPLVCPHSGEFENILRQCAGSQGHFRDHLSTYSPHLVVNWPERGRGAVLLSHG